MVNHLQNGYGDTLNVDTVCQQCDYDSEHWIIPPLFFGTPVNEPRSDTIEKIRKYYQDRISHMQNHANTTGHLCDVHIHYLNLHVEIVPSVWSRLTRALLILRGLEYDYDGRLRRTSN